MAQNHITHRALECIRGGLGGIKGIVFGKSSHSGFNPFLALKYLAEGLIRSPHIERMSLMSDFTSEHKYHLLVLIMSCKSLKFLQLFSCNLSGAIPVLAAAFKYRRIASLFMINCSLNDEDLCELGNMLDHCRDTLFVLGISGNTFSSKAYTKFLETIRDSKCVLNILNCDQYHNLNPTQQSIVDDIQRWRTTHQMSELYVGQYNHSTFISTLYQNNAILQSLPLDIVHGLRS